MSNLDRNWQQTQDYYQSIENKIKGNNTIENVETKQVLPIKVDGHFFPMHSDYNFDLKKVYAEDPSRALDGSIRVFPQKFFIPYFTVTYSLLPIDVYQEMMRSIQNDTINVMYYDSFNKKYKTAQFYAQQPSYNQLYAMKQEYNYIINLEIVFAGTLGDTTKAYIEYNAGDGVFTDMSIYARQEGYVGDEFICASGSGVSKTGYTFAYWQDQNGFQYTQNAKYTFNTAGTTVLTAIYVPMENYIVTLSYGNASHFASLETSPDSITIPISTKLISGLPTGLYITQNDILSNNIETEFLDANNDAVFSFQGWTNKVGNTLENGYTIYNNGSTYPISGNSSMYAKFKARQYTFTFNSNGGTALDPITLTYGEKYTFANPKKENSTFDGWYTDSQLQNKFITSDWNKSPQNLILYAKWS